MGYFNEIFVKWLYKNGVGEGIQIQDNGSLKSVGDSILWDDLKTNPTTAPSIGSNIPNYEVIMNDGSASTGTAFEFNGSTSNGVVPYYSDLNVNNMSISLWIKPVNAKNRELVDRAGNNGFEFYIENKRLGFAIDGSHSKRTDKNSIVAGATQFVTVTVEDIGTRSTIRLYINGIKEIESNVNTHLDNNTYDLMFGEYYGGGWHYDGVMDDMQMYNLVLTDAQILEQYNNGQGITGLPTGITETTDLLFRFQDSLTNIATIGTGYDIVNTDITFVDGLVGISTGSVGVIAWAFEPGVTSSLFSSAQLPHKYEEGTDIIPHVHWLVKDTDIGNIVFGMEYIWFDINEYETNTTLITTTVDKGTSGNHQMSNLPTLDGTDKKISSILNIRIFRDGSNPLDTYPGKVYMNQFDFHFRLNTQGSRQVGIK